MLSTHKVLGLAVSELGIDAAEVTIAEGRRSLSHVASVAFTPSAGLAQPDALGKALRQALREGGISGGRCVIGLCANWLATKEKQLPATDDDSLRGVLSIAAEREFASGSGELIFDYTQAVTTAGISALLVAAPRKLVADLLTMAKAAGLSVAAITSTTASLAVQTSGTIGPSGRLVLCLLDHGVELAVQSPQALRQIRRLPVRTDATGQLDGLASELRRTLAFMPPAAGAPEVVVWNASGAAAAALSGIQQAMGVSMRSCELGKDLALTPGPKDAQSLKYAQAAALACGGQNGAGVDFLHSRLAPPKKARFGRRAVLIAVAVVAIIAGAVFLLLDWRSSQQDVTRLEGQLKRVKSSVDDARELVDNVSFVSNWYDRRPQFLNCIKEVTQGFPEDGRIWATRLTIKENMQVQLSGKSSSQQPVLELLDRLKANPRLDKVKQLYIRQAGGNSKDFSFAIELGLKGTK